MADNSSISTGLPAQPATPSPAIPPNEQYQIGDVVVYIPAGVVTTVSGYRWELESRQWGGASRAYRIDAYELEAGITVPGSALRYATLVECVRRGGKVR